ncbi:pentapeptide repeat-containing protein [Rhizobium sp. ARZ01]|uniref:pentapeptide repeat-containing protein n=1 Tax=Rhizobium sp. ARZ01 TaxID=2769313 RepID=UPI001780DA8F|nr:pentapeptide repeat-containing protein [Rhizobium sp. ARZ01]MBD9371442.1 pentapeptide repeat-containing protein [Rhizobium sp. ARZ01]
MSKLNGQEVPVGRKALKAAEDSHRSSWFSRQSGVFFQLLAVGLPLALVTAAAPAARAADCSSSPEPGIDWSECSKRALMLEGSDFRGANLTGADLMLTDLSRTNMNGANLEKASLARAWFTGATAEKANFNRIEGFRTGFDKVSAAGATFASAELQRASFKGANLTGVDFEKAELGRADFSGAVLTGVRFPYANLSRADLSKAIFEGGLDLSHAFLFLTRIEGLDLSSSTGLEQEQIDLACGNASTRLPAGFTAPPTWPCPFD